MTTIAVIGAAGSVGRNVCDVAVERELSVVAIDRSFDGAQRRSAIAYRTANALSDDLTPALADCDVVVSTLGLSFGLRAATDPPPLYSKGTAAIVSAMQKHDMRRLAVISAAFVVPQRSLPGWFAFTVVPALHAILDEMRAMERIVAASGLDWTIARPGWLLDEPARDDLEVADALLPSGAFRCREADLAAFLVDVVTSDRWIGQRPAIGAPDTAFNESPLSLGAMLLPAVCGTRANG